jgi:hypothetical protein
MGVQRQSKSGSSYEQLYTWLANNISFLTLDIVEDTIFPFFFLQWRLPQEFLSQSKRDPHISRL